MKAAVDQISRPAYGLRAARINEKNARMRAKEVMEKEHPGWLEPQDPPDAEYLIAWARMTVDLYNAWIAEPEAKFNEATAQLEAVRARFIKRGQSELKATN